MGQRKPGGHELLHLKIKHWPISSRLPFSAAVVSPHAQLRAEQRWLFLVVEMPLPVLWTPWGSHTSQPFGISSSAVHCATSALNNLGRARIFLVTQTEEHRACPSEVWSLCSEHGYAASRLLNSELLINCTLWSDWIRSKLSKLCSTRQTLSVGSITPHN